ncbi:hypothetical protein [Priestia megaterium]|uniref:hypothetical protein n=1 Tax=Priestia megaterium TaxID=1404 RepID=UPI000BEBA503|nr:hypothetical protein [Priestia megaterium]PED64038.1 hypothetical protein CON20_24045 [Priestia megaterium]
MTENQQLKLQVEQLQLQVHDQNVWEHFSDHLIIATAFLFLGFLLCSYIIMVLFKKRIKLDHDLPKGTIMRLVHNDKKWLIINPSSVLQWYDVLLLSFFDFGKKKFIEKHSKIRLRIINIVLLLFMVSFILSGVLEIFSALQMDMNPINYIDELIKFEEK